MVTHGEPHASFNWRTASFWSASWIMARDPPSAAHWALASAMLFSAAQWTLKHVFES